MSSTSGTGAATQVYSKRFDQRFFALPKDVQERIQDSLDRMGRRLDSFPHYRMEGSDTCRLRVGDYRVIYQFDLRENKIFLIATGHRRDIYKEPLN